MTVGLMGSGTEVDPWLIETSDHFKAVVRDASSSGHYRLVNDIYSDAWLGTGWALEATTAARAYSAKVLDGGGFGVNAFSAGQGSWQCAFAGIHFKNIRIRLYFQDQFSGSSGSIYPFYNCSMTDVVVQFHLLTIYSGRTRTVYLCTFSTSFVPFEPNKWDRVVVLGTLTSPEGGASLAPLDRPLNTSAAPAIMRRVYAYSSDTVGSGVTKLNAVPTVALLDDLTAGEFSDSGWHQVELLPMPWQTEAVSLLVSSLAEGSAASRMLWLEAAGFFRYIGETDSEGTAQLSVRVPRYAGFSLMASEDFRLGPLHEGGVVSSSVWYLPPAGDAFVYKADLSGRVIGLDNVLFADQPVTVNGITFTPRARYSSVISTRRSLSRDGISQVVLLDTSGGGGGPVIEGDPAYLDGIVEEVHPMTGARQALTNCEVVAFERRGSDYVAMGSTYSDGIGGFRLETEVYGGGDVFAFAADFPGVIFQPGVSLNAGDRIRPALANGYVYEIVQPGTAGGAEPVWWPDQGGGTEGDIGTARARARPYYQPVGHGPLKMTLIE